MSIRVTVEFPEGTKTAAKALLESHGFTVVRVTTTADATITPRDRFMRANALTDMPEGLTPMEQNAYIRGYAKGCCTYTHKHGAPSITGTGSVDKVALRLRTIDHEWDRHPAAHKAAMRELRTHQERHAAYQEALRIAS